MTNEQLNKVAKITLIFWIMKIVATTLGETLEELQRRRTPRAFRRSGS